MAKNAGKSNESKKRSSLNAVCRDDPTLPERFTAACKEMEPRVFVQDALKLLARWWIGLSPSNRATFYFQGFEAMLSARVTPSDQQGTLREMVDRVVEEKLATVLKSEALMEDLVRRAARVSASRQSEQKSDRESKMDCPAESG